MPTLTNVVSTIRHATLGDFLDILLIAIILYSIFLLIKDTKAYQMAIGLGLVGILFLLTQWGKLVVSNRLIRSFINYIIIAIIVLFQGEIRRFLTGIGSRTFRKPLALRSLQEKLEDVFIALEYLSMKRIGALIAIEKEISLVAVRRPGDEDRRPAVQGPPRQHLLPPLPPPRRGRDHPGEQDRRRGLSPAPPRLPQPERGIRRPDPASGRPGAVAGDGRGRPRRLRGIRGHLPGLQGECSSKLKGRDELRERLVGYLRKA